VWAVSKQNQLEVLKGLGGTPTRKSVVAEPDVLAARQRPTTMPNALTFDAVYDYGIKDPHFVLGPKFPKTNEYHQILATEVQLTLSGQSTPEEACQSIKEQVDALTGA
jgi:multiple sugar transport system substrate-binding protein